MKKIIRLTAIVLICMMVGVGALVLAGGIVMDWMETVETYHSDYQSLKASKQFDWLPDSLPESSRSIDQRHNLDTNRVWFCFSLPAKDKQDFLNRLTPAKEAFVDRHRVRTPYRVTYDLLGAVEWWPEWLKNDGASLESFGKSIRFYFSRRREEWGTVKYIYALKKDSPKICGWTDG